MLGYRDFARATTLFEKFIQLQPNNADGFSLLGIAEARQGRWPEALDNFRKTAELEPGSWRLGWLVTALRAAAIRPQCSCASRGQEAYTRAPP